MNVYLFLIYPIAFYLFFKYFYQFLTDEVLTLQNFIDALTRDYDF